MLSKQNIFFRYYFNCSSLRIPQLRDEAICSDYEIASVVTSLAMTFSIYVSLVIHLVHNRNKIIP